MRLLLVALLLATTSSAQDGRLVLREAVAGPPPAREVDPRTGISFQRIPPPTMEADTTGLERALLPDGGTVWLGDVLLDWTDGGVAGVGAEVDPYTGSPQISIVLSDTAAEAFAALTKARRGERIAIVLDGRVLTAPTIQERIPNGRVMISGDFTQDEVEAAVAAIREATGAADARAEALDAVRRAVDQTSPEATARSFLAAIRARDWLTVARLVHPDARAELRESVGGALALDGDVATAEGVGGEASVEAVLGRAAPPDGVAGLDDAEVLALVLELTGVFAQLPDAPRVAGVVHDGPDRAFVVLRPESDLFEMDGFTLASVVGVERREGQWVLLMPM